MPGVVVDNDVAAPIDPQRLVFVPPPLTAMMKLRNYISWAFIIGSSVFMGPPLDVMLAILRPFGLASRLGDAIIVWWVGWLRALWQVEVEVTGLEHIVQGQPYVIIANHRSHLDAVSMLHALRKHLRFGFIVKASLCVIPIWGWFIWLNGYVPVGRSRRRQDQLAAPARQVRAGRSVVIFAEGTRAKSHRFLPFKRGAVVLASRAGVPLLPIVVSGSGPLLPKNELRVRKGKVRIEVLPPIDPRALTGVDKDAIVDDVREKIAQRYRLTADGAPAVLEPALLSELLGKSKRRPPSTI